MASVKSYARLWPLAFAAIGVAGLGVAGFRWLSDEPPAQTAGSEPQADVPLVDPGPDEHFEPVREHFVDEFTTYRGQVKAGSPIEVRVPQGMAVAIVKIHRESGDFVKKGDLLITFHKQAIDDAIEQAKADGKTDDEARFRSYLAFVECKAPCDGVVDQIYRHQGEISLDMNADGQGPPLMTLQNKDAFQFVVRVPVDVGQRSMVLGTKYEIELEDDLGTVSGTVVAFDPPAGPDVPVVIGLDPHEGIQDRLAGAVKVASGRQEAGLVPKSAVTQRGDVSIVRAWSPESKSIGDRTVKLGREIGPDVVILAGVFKGDSVVVPGREPRK